MAARMPAVRRGNLQTEVSSDVAIQARNIGMPIREREIDRRGGVIYCCAQPTVKRVAVRASLRELTGHVIRIFGLLKIWLVARNACR